MACIYLTISTWLNEQKIVLENKQNDIDRNGKTNNT